MNAALRKSSPEDDGDVTTVMPATLASEGLAGEEPTTVRPRAIYSLTIQRILLLPPRFPEDPDDDAPTEVSDRPPPSAPRPIDRRSSAKSINAIAFESLLEDEDGEAGDDGSDRDIPLEIAPDPFARREARESLIRRYGSWIRLAWALPFRLVLATLKLACAVGLFLWYAAKALFTWLLYRSWAEWLRAWRRTHASLSGPEDGS